MINMSSMELTAFNRRVKKWAKTIPSPYNKSALAIGYVCDKETYEATAELQWISDKSRWRHDGNEFVSLRTLERHLPWLVNNGYVTKTKHVSKGKNQASTYRVNLPLDGVESDPNESWPRFVRDDMPKAQKPSKAKPTKQDVLDMRAFLTMAEVGIELSEDDIIRGKELLTLDWSDYPEFYNPDS
jgi:hypothetical protein